MKKELCIIFILLFNVIFYPSMYSCSIFYAAIGNSVLAGNSEDWDDINSMIRFFPPQNGKYGRIVYGVKDWGLDFCPYGGVNDQGLFYDWASTGARNTNFHAQGTQNYSGVLADRMEEECSTVEEAIELFKKYNSPGFGGAHILIGDRFGNSVVIEESENNTLAFIRKKGNYQITTNTLNAYLDDPKVYRWIQCPRYQYIDETLKDKDSISIGLFQKILQHVGNNNGAGSHTIYSNVYDLKSGKVYIYNYFNFEEVLILDIKKEMDKEYRFYKLPELFSKIKAEYPVSGVSVNSSSIELKWVGDATNYVIWLSSNDQFTDAKAINYSESEIQKAGFGILYSLILFLFIIPCIKKNKNLLYMGVFCLIFFAGCEKTELPETRSNIEHVKTIDNLEPNKVYYWKVVANNRNGFDTETKVESFTTSSF
jgi:predicted choloylglycine hydrolase